MEETVSGGLSLAVLVCRLFFGAADCVEPPRSATPIAQMPPTAECTDTVPWYEMVLADDDGVLDEGHAATIEQRLARPETCRLTVTPQADGTIRVGIATRDNPMELVAPILQPGQLSFHRVIDDLPPGAPVGQDQMALRSADDADVYIVEAEPLLGGRAIASAEATFTTYGEWAVSIRFTDKGAERFGEITADMFGQRLAIVLDRRVLSAPMIREAIRGGSAQISGGFTEAQAHEMAAMLASAPLPAGVHISSIESP